MPALLLLTVSTTISGAALLTAMCRRRDPYLGVLGLITLCAGGITGSAYGVLHSAG